jgi:L-fuconolactonase
VVDHLGCWSATGDVGPAGVESLKRPATDNLFVKLSGFHHFSKVVFPYRTWFTAMRCLVEAFGPRRLMLGSDFPHSTLTCGYTDSLRVIDQALPSLSQEDRQWILGQTAASLYWPT